MKNAVGKNAGTEKHKEMKNVRNLQESKTKKLKSFALWIAGIYNTGIINQS
jgi:hypothetical protein